LRVIWQLGDMVSTALFEFSAMAMRSKAIKVEMKHYMDEFRRMEAQAITRHLKLRGITPTIPPMATAFVINSVAHTLAAEKALDVTEGHVETKALMEGWLRAFAQQGEFSMGRPKARLVASRRR